MFVPHKANQYRPHLIRMHGVTAVLVLALLFQVAYGFMTAGRLAVLGHVSSIDTTELVLETNEARATEQLPALVINPALNQAAELKANDMIANGYWAHVSPSGVSPWKWFSDAGYSYAQAGENLAKNYPNASATVDAWMNSPAHRANIMNKNFTEVGFAVMSGEIDGRETDIVVAFYGVPKGTPIAAGTEKPGQSVDAPASASGIEGMWTTLVNSAMSLTPATFVGILLLTAVAIVGAIAHHYRHKLPAAWKRSWKMHHGLFIVIGATSLALTMIFATGGGQL